MSAGPAVESRRRGLSATLLGVLALSGCGDAGSSNATDRTTAVQPSSQMRWELDDTPRWGLREDFRIGGPEDPSVPEVPGYHLTVVTTAFLGPNDEIIVDQIPDHAFRMFDATGEHLRTVGRPGQGPGEFGRIDGLGLHKGLVHAGDRTARRVNFFTIDGELDHVVSRWASPTVRTQSATHQAAAPSVVLDDGSGLTVPETWVRADAYKDSDYAVEQYYFRVWPESETFDTVAVVPRRSSESPIPTVTVQGRVSRVGTPFTGTPSSSLSPDGAGVVVVDPMGRGDRSTPHFTVFLITPDGDTAWSVDHEFTPKEIPEALLQEFVDGTVRRISSNLEEDGAVTEGQVLRSMRSAGAIPEAAPTVEDVFVDQDGRIWLQREEEVGPLRTWTCLSPAGEPLGQIRLETEQSIVASRDSLLVVRDRGPYGATFLIRYTVEGMVRDGLEPDP